MPEHVSRLQPKETFETVLAGGGSNCQVAVTINVAHPMAFALPVCYAVLDDAKRINPEIPKKVNGNSARTFTGCAGYKSRTLY